MAGFDPTVKDDAITLFHNVTLSNNLNYTTRFSIDSLLLIMTVGHTDRNSKRWITLETLDGDIVLSQTYVAWNRRCELTNLSQILGINYYLTLESKTKGLHYPNNHDYINWSNDFTLCFVGFSQELRDRLDSNFVAVAVGNTHGRNN